MTRNPHTGTIILRPEDWQLRPAEFPAKAGPPPDPAQIPRTMLVSDAAPYIALLEEPANHFSPVHHHTEAEVMVVLSGGMMLNGEWCGPGSLIYMPAEEEYWHATLDEACVVAVIRNPERGLLVHGTDTRVARARQRAEAAGKPHA